MAHAAQQEVTILRETHHPFFDLYKRSDGIIVWVTHDLWFTKREARDFVHAMHEITSGIPHLLLVLAGRRSSIDKEGRSYLASEEAMKDIKAMAAVINSNPLRIIANLFLTVDQPVKPVRFFDNSQAALAWLQAESF